MLDKSHVLTAGALSFARGLNDTLKIAALLLMLQSVSDLSAVLMVGIAIAFGSLLAVMRVAQTMSYRITGMNDGQAFTASLTTACLVIVARRFRLPVSTTHVSCGSLFGIGMVNRQTHGRMIGQVIAAWVTTLPVAGALGWIAWKLIGA